MMPVTLGLMVGAGSSIKLRRLGTARVIAGSAVLGRPV